MLHNRCHLLQEATFRKMPLVGSERANGRIDPMISCLWSFSGSIPQKRSRFYLLAQQKRAFRI